PTYPQVYPILPDFHCGESCMSSPPLGIDAPLEQSYSGPVPRSPIQKSSDSSRRTSVRVVRFRSPGASLGLRASNINDLIHQLEQGFSFTALQDFASNSGLSLSEITAIVGIHDRTLSRRKAANKLTTDESERLLRLSTVFDRAVELFEGDTAG